MLILDLLILSAMLNILVHNGINITGVVMISQTLQAPS